MGEIVIIGTNGVLQEMRGERMWRRDREGGHMAN